MKKIRAYVSYNEHTNTHYWREFEVVNDLPSVGEIIYGSDYDGEKTVVTRVEEAYLDCEGNDRNIREYNLYVVDTEFWSEESEYDEATGKWVKMPWAKQYDERLYIAIERDEKFDVEEDNDE